MVVEDQARIDFSGCGIQLECGCHGQKEKRVGGEEESPLGSSSRAEGMKKAETITSICSRTETRVTVYHE